MLENSNTVFWRTPFSAFQSMATQYSAERVVIRRRGRDLAAVISLEGKLDAEAADRLRGHTSQEAA